MADPPKIPSDKGIEIDALAKERGVDQSDSELSRVTAVSTAGAVDSAEVATFATSDLAIASTCKSNSVAAQVMEQDRARRMIPRPLREERPAQMGPGLQQ